MSIPGDSSNEAVGDIQGGTVDIGSNEAFAIAACAVISAASKPGWPARAARPAKGSGETGGSTVRMADTTVTTTAAPANAGFHHQPGGRGEGFTSARTRRIVA